MDLSSSVCSVLRCLREEEENGGELPSTAAPGIYTNSCKYLVLFTVEELKRRLDEDRTQCWNFVCEESADGVEMENFGEIPNSEHGN